ncbi:hypothetical protein OPIT5_07315 [Opitutaceae bacterium TAV5]|nr:hypothetical protein OPIT5_07315 [Opitutaceae bacterium TAV5]
MKTKIRTAGIGVVAVKGLFGVLACGLLLVVVPSAMWGQESEPGSESQRVDAEQRQQVREEVARRRAARQAGIAGPVPTQVTNPGPLAAESAAKRYDLEFPGGTPAQLVAAIRKASEGPCNLIIAPDVAELAIPPLSLGSTTTPRLLRSLAQILSSSNRATLFCEDRAYQDEAAVWVMVQDQNNRPSTSLRCQARNIDFLLIGYSVDEITNALSTAWKLQGNELPRFVYDKATTLLLVSGTDRQLGLMDEVLTQMNDSAKRRAREKASLVPESVKSGSLR